jgi:hypothetical protein
MNLNFVDPPIPAGVQAYDPLITAENAGAELERIADWIETDELLTGAFEDEAIASFTFALRELPGSAGLRDRPADSRSRPVHRARSRD